MSVANALTLCSTTLNLEQFNDSETTVQFCKTINNIFDFLNSRNFLSKSEYQKPLKSSNEEEIMLFIKNSIEYLQSLKCENKNKEKILLVKSQRKTGFLGFIICLQSVYNIFEDTDKPDILDFLLMYKLSQDHIEVFFSAIRARGGFNNNPTAAQFESSYKRLLIHTELMVSSGANCLPLDLTTILTVSSTNKNEDTITNTYIDMLCAEDNSLLEDDLMNDVSVENIYIINVVEYIAGFIVRKVQRIMVCDTCLEVLEQKHSNLRTLIAIKNRGGLKQPSTDLVKLCKIAEKIFKHYESNITKIPSLINYLIIKATSAINIKTIFISLSDHILNQTPMNNHLLQLLHLIFKTYFTIRVHHYTKLISQPKDRIRSYLTKTIHFKNQ